MSEVEQLATDIVFMSEGEIAFSGTVDSLRSKTGEADVERALARIFEDRAGSMR
jgi:ABC-type multidrug transport system ATPase subunit